MPNYNLGAGPAPVARAKDVASPIVVVVKIFVEPDHELVPDEILAPKEVIMLNFFRG